MQQNPSSLFKTIIISLINLSRGNINPQNYIKENELNNKEKGILLHLADVLQLPERAELGLEYGTNLVNLNKNKYKFLFVENPYLELYEYLHGKEFQEYQTNFLQLYYGFFAYVNRELNQFRYLVSSQDLPSDKGKEPPHFFLKAYYYNHQEEIYYPEGKANLETIMDAIYFSQKRERPSSIDFVNILRNNSNFKKKRTAFEREHDMIYVPSGEIDSCLFCWFFLTQTKETRKDLISIIFSPGESAQKCETLCHKNLKINWKRIDEYYFPGTRDKISYPYRHESFSLMEWLVKFGLIELKNDKTKTFTERGLRMVSWINLYLKTIQKQDAKDELYYLMERISHEVSIPNTNPNEKWLNYYRSTRMAVSLDKAYQLKTSQLTLLIDDFIKQSDKLFKDKSKPIDGVLFPLMAILLVWNEGTDDYDEQLSHFQDRCRFDILAHFVLRIIPRQNFQPASSRGWLAFPILRDNNENQTEKGIVGFFLGAIKDKTKDDLGYFEEIHRNNVAVKKEISNHVMEMKAVINIIAKVENREVYYNEVKREAEERSISIENERIYAHANKYLFGSIASSALKLLTEFKTVDFFQKTTLTDIAEELYIKSKIIQINYTRRELLTKSRQGVNTYEKDIFSLKDFFQYLFIINEFNSIKGTLNLKQNKRYFEDLREILFQEDFMVIKKRKDIIKKIFQQDFSKRNIHLDIDPSLKIVLPKTRSKAYVQFYFNFLALVNNFFQHWIGEYKRGVKYVLHICYKSNEKKLYLFQSKVGRNYSAIYNFEGAATLEEFINLKEFDWEELPYPMQRQGVRDLRKFFFSLFGAQYTIYRHTIFMKEIKLGLMQTGRKETIVYQSFDGIDDRLIKIEK